MALPYYDQTSADIRICNGNGLYNIYIGGIKLLGAYGPDVINSIIDQQDNHKCNVSKNLPDDMPWEIFKRHLREFPKIPE